MVRILFVRTGTLLVSQPQGTKFVTSKQCACLARSEEYVVTAHEQSEVIILSLEPRAEICELDIFGLQVAGYPDVPTDAVPTLALHPAVERLLSDMFDFPALAQCERFHRLKVSELFMLFRVLHTPSELAYFFQRMMQPQDNFRAFVCNNYERAQGVTDLASLAGMSLSVFKRRFAEHFNDSVYHWMMRQKALKIYADIRDGEDSTKALMEKYKFRHYTQFSRFCKNYLQATPAQLIAEMKRR